VTTEQIRPIAIGIFRRDDRILVFESRERDSRGRIFYRPLGGSIEFGEYGDEALARELREELGAEIENVRYLGLNENLFRAPDGQRAHEIVLVYEADLVDRTLYDKSELLVTEDTGDTFKAFWKSLAFFQRGEAPLYPNGLLELLMDDEASPPPGGADDGKERVR
jgi:8-oxo-dGTP pyrophosphatase MutT (NUDIX family)